MPKTAEEVLTGVLSTTYKLDETGVAALKEADGSFKDDAIEFLTKQDAERVATLRGDVEKVKTERYSQGKREALEALEKELRDEYQVKSTDAKGKELVKAIVALKLQSATSLTDEQVKAHPMYLELEKHTAAIPQTIEEKVKEAEERVRSEFKAERDQRTVLSKAVATLKGMNPILPKNEAIANAQLSLLENAVKSGKYQLVEKDGEIVDIVPMKADGSGRLEDAHGHPIKFETHIKDLASKMYEFSDGDDRSGADDPNKVGGGGKGKGDGAFDPKTPAEYAKLFADIEKLPDVKERLSKWAELKEAAKRNGVI
jgi:hypothetical protein